MAKWHDGPDLRNADDWRIVANEDPSRLPPPSRSLTGAARFAPLSGESPHSVTSLDGEPVNPYSAMDGNFLNTGFLP